jgi:pimeloyl-ACP methyl ester carboxylesterase
MAVVVLFLTAVILRVFGTVARQSAGALFYIVGWMLCAIAGWLMASAVGALSPLWLVFVLGVGGALIDFRRSRQVVWSGADALTVVSAGLLSVLRVDYIALLGFALVGTGIGFLIDLAICRSSNWLRVRALQTLIAVSVVGVLVSAVKFSYPSQPRLLLAMLRNGGLLHSGILPVHEGKRIVLATGAVAWLDQPSSSGPFSAVLFFHGADTRGSRQSSAIVLRRALMDAGFAVLSVDHPGFGDSPVPTVDSEIAAWNPLPTGLSALETLRSIPGIDKIYVIGHSMGATDVLRLLRVDRRLAGAVIFGAALDDSAGGSDYWYKRFHTDRRMRHYISRDQFMQIIGEYYNVRSFVQALPLDHAPLLFVRFSQDWPNIIAGREPLYNAIPGPKLDWTIIGSHHYFNSHQWALMILADTRVMRSLVDKFHHLSAYGLRPSIGEVQSSP